MSAPVLLQRQQLDRLWDIDRSEIIDTLYRLQDGKLQAYPDYYDVRGWDPHDRETYTPIHEACFDRGGAFFARFEGEEIVAAAALDTEPRGPQRDLRQLLFFTSARANAARGWASNCFNSACVRRHKKALLGYTSPPSPTKAP